MRKWLLVLLFFNGISGLAGGYGLISDPSGSALEMKLRWLESSPFSDYLVPGIILFTVNGLGNLAAAVILIIMKNRALLISAVFGGIMIFWIISQVLMIGYKSFLQPLYFSTGLLVLILSLLLMRKKVED